jgi:hypothetical protein
MPSAALSGCCCTIVGLKGSRSAPIVTMLFFHGYRLAARRCLEYMLSQLPPTTTPTPLAALHRRFTPPHRTHRRTLSGHLADRGVDDADRLQTLSSGAWNKAVGSARTVALRWVPPPTVGAIAGGRQDSTVGSDRAEVSCRSLCKRRRPGPQTWFADLSTVASAPTFSSPQTLQRPELARHHESRKKVSSTSATKMSLNCRNHTS